MAIATFTLKLPAEFHREGEWVVARFPHLDVTSQGRDHDEAARNLIEAAQLFVESCFERNVLDEVIKACGFSPGSAQRAEEQEQLTVPVNLLARNDGSSSHAN